jgi:nucleotide-binding universal stress UspA family protein
VASRAFKPIHRVLIAFDGGPSVTRAVEFLARSYASFAGLEMRLLKVGQCTDDAARRVETSANQLRGAGYLVQSSIVAGQPEVEIARTVEADKIDLLVMGAYGHSRIRSLIIGSTTTEMIRSCKIPVVLFR